MSMHDGHRERLKNRFRQEGLDNFDELYVLELLLFYCIPRKDTNPLAHRLLEHFGSLTGVLDASPQELEKVDEKASNMSYDIPAQAKYFHDVVCEAMKEVRTPADKLECLVAKEAWPFPTYGELLFEQ